VGLFGKRSVLVYTASAALGAATEIAFQIEANTDLLREPRLLTVAILAGAAFVVYFAINLILAAVFALVPFLRSLEARTITVAASALALPHFIYLVTIYAPLPPAGHDALYVFVVAITPLIMAALVHLLRYPPVKRVAALAFACVLIVGLSLLLVPHFLHYGAAKKPNVILITFDAVRPDHLGAYGYETSDQPNISLLSDKGLAVEGVTCEIPVSEPSHACIMTSLDAGNHKVIFNRTPLDENVLTLPDVLKSEGYSTGAFLGGSPLWAEDSGLNRGFDRYDDATGQVDAYTSTPLIGRHLAVSLGILKSDDNPFERPADEVTDRALKWLNSRPDGPFFLWVNYFDAHDDYLPPPEFAPEGLKDRDAQMRTNKAWGTEEKPPPELAERIIRLYDGEIAFIDREIGRLIAHLEEKGLLENTIICVVGAYGEAFGEHGNKYHGLNVYGEDIRIPLVFYDGGTDVPPLHVTGRSPLSTLDVAPSVLDLAGVTIPPAMEGRSVFAEGPGRDYGFSAAIPDPTRFQTIPYEGVYAIYGGDFKLIRYVSDQVPRTEFYDLTDDPGEKNNLVDKEPERFAEMNAALEKYIKSFPDFDASFER
jgi:arylsulfatase A-like enzyme